MHRIPPIRTCARVGLVFATLLTTLACAGQELADRAGISFRYSRLASFDEILPEDPIYTQALDEALRATGVARHDVGALPRVLKGSSLWVDPPYLGRTAYLEGSVFVWEGTEVPVGEVLTHEMIHWVLFHVGQTDLAQNESYVEHLMGAVAREEGAFSAAPTGGPGRDRADRARWYDAGARQRNAARHRRGVFDRDEPDTWGLAHERARTWVPRHQ